MPHCRVRRPRSPPGPPCGLGFATHPRVSLRVLRVYVHLPLPPSTLPQARQLHTVLAARLQVSSPGAQRGCGPGSPIEVQAWAGLQSSQGLCGCATRPEPRPTVEGLRAQVPCPVS